MPPKIVRPKAKSQMSKNAKNSKVFKKPFKLEPLVEEKTEEEEKAVEEVPPKKVSWLDTLHWSPPPDQELHNQLSKQRREQTHKKHFNYCHEEIHAILNYAFATRKLTDPKAIRRERIAFEKGFYIPKEEEPDYSLLFLDFDRIFNKKDTYHGKKEPKKNKRKEKVILLDI